MDSFLGPPPQFEREENIDKCDGGKPDVIGNRADSEPEPEKIEANQEGADHEEQNKISEKRNPPVQFHKITDGSCNGDYQQYG
jgi:hypothetical protein